MSKSNQVLAQSKTLRDTQGSTSNLPLSKIYMNNMSQKFVNTGRSSNERQSNDSQRNPLHNRLPSGKSR